MVLPSKASLDGARAIVDDYRLIDQHVLSKHSMNQLAVTALLVLAACIELAVVR